MNAKVYEPARRRKSGWPGGGKDALSEMKPGRKEKVGADEANIRVENHAGSGNDGGKGTRGEQSVGNNVAVGRERGT